MVTSKQIILGAMALALLLGGVGWSMQGGATRSGSSDAR